MNGARIIQLTSPSSMPQAVSFEEAFGEYSNLRGRGRARRKARRLERIANRDEVKRARRESRIARRSDRVARRQENLAAMQERRLARRQRRVDARAERKMAKEMGRQDRENFALEQQLMRESMQPQGIPTTESAGYEGDGLGVATTQSGGYLPTTQSGGYMPTTQSGGYMPTTQSAGYFPTTQSGGYLPSTQSGYYEDEMPLTQSGYYEDGGFEETGDVFDQSLVDETAQSAYDMGYQDAQENTGLDVEITGDEDYGDFDGVMGAEDRFNELQDKNDMPVNPQVQAIADKCVWNEMLIKKLKNQRKNAKGNPQMISKTIISRTQRMKNLKNELEDYANYVGEYSNAEGTNEMIAKRKRVVQVAMNRARRKASGQAPVNLTSVPRRLNPKMSKNRIVVNSSEAMANATGTGITALDNINDYDSPDTREFYIPADGNFTKGIDLGSIALGALITVGFIYFNNKYKWIKM